MCMLSLLNCLEVTKFLLQVTVWNVPPGNLIPRFQFAWSYDQTKHGPYHSWQLVFHCGFHEIRQISHEIWWILWTLADFMWNHDTSSFPTALHETEEFFLNYLIYKVFMWVSRNLVDFTWKPEIWAFGWSPSIGPS